MQKRETKYWLIIPLLFMLICNNALGQSISKVDLNLQNSTLGNFFTKIEAQTGYTVMYNNVDLNQPVSIKSTQESLESVLQKVLSAKNIKFEIIDKRIILNPQNSKGDATATPQASQVKKVTGVVVDNKGEPIIGATVKEKGTANGVITDIDGSFSLNITGNGTLEITYLGYNTKDIQVNNQSNINITLGENTQLLDEVIVVGYGTMKKRDLTGAVSSVKMSDNPVGTVSSVSQVLAGKAAGLQVSTVSAQPGGGATFRIRGAASPTKEMNQPLIIIDGFPVSTPTKFNEDTGKEEEELNAGNYKTGTTDNILGSINPSDIESIEVLKDASSSAIYGARAGNGVIIITTKRGKKGEPVVKYSGTVSVQDIAKNYEILDAREFMIQSNRYHKEDWLRSNKIAPYGNVAESSVKPFAPRYSDSQIAAPEYNTDWLDAVMRRGFQTQHNVSVSGGTENTQYLVSGNFFEQQGIAKKNDVTRYTGRLNLDQKLSKYFKLGVNFTLSRNTFDNVPLGAGQNEYASLFVSAAQFNPLLPIKDKEGNYPLNTEAAYLPNPASLLEISDVTTKERLLAVTYLEFEPMAGLKLKANLGLDRNYLKRKVYLPKATLYGQKAGGKADIGQSDRSDYLGELTANYSKIIGEHNLTVLGGYSFQQFNNEGVGLSNNRFLTDAFSANNIGAGGAPKPGVSSDLSKEELASFFARVNYSYKDRYLLTATFRADGASNFAENHRWGYFPSVSLGWRFLDEAFMSPMQDILSNGKLRVSYGETGRSNIGNRVLSLYEVGNNNTFGDAEYQGVYLSQIGNPNLKWETTGEWNFGIDLGFLNNRINVTAEYFNRVISDLLNKRPLQSQNEVTKVWANIGKTQSSGFELTINTQNVNGKDFSWSTDYTFSLYRDKWKERDPYWKPNAYSLYNEPLRGTFGYLSDGIVQAGEAVKHMPDALPGYVKLKDIDGFQYNADGSIPVDDRGFPIKTGQPDGRLNDADKVFYGSDDPGYLMGLNNTFTYKNFDMNIYFYAQLDKTKYGSYKDLWLTGSEGMTGIANMYRGYNMPTTASDVWTHDNQSAFRPGYFQNKNTYGVGDYFKQDASFVRCRNITLGYNFKVKQSKKVFSNLRVYVDINNPFIITSYKGLDPETDDTAWAYPNVRSYSLGLDITF